MALYLLQLLVLMVYLTLFLFQHLSLVALIGSIFTYEAQASVHLGQTFGTEYEGKFFLYGMMACHVTHGLHKFHFTFLKLFFQRFQL